MIVVVFKLTIPVSRLCSTTHLIADGHQVVAGFGTPVGPMASACSRRGGNSLVLSEIGIPKKKAVKPFFILVFLKKDLI